jgi:hypothetical protein
MELQRERKSEARESLEASSPPDPGDRQGAGGAEVPGMAQTSSCEVSDVPKGQAGTGDSIQPVSGEFGDVWQEERAITPIAGGTAALLIFLGAVLAAAFKNIKNRGNELKDLLQRQGIAEIAASKRTHFRAEKAALGAERSGISRIVRLAVPWLKRSCAIQGGASPTHRVATFQMLYRSHHCALSGQRLPATVLTSGTSV